MGDSKIDALNFEGSQSRLVIDGMAGDTSIARHTNELFPDLDLVGPWFFDRGFRSGKTVMSSHSMSQVFSMKWKGRHTHLEPWSWSGACGAEKHFLNVSSVEHRSHMGERRPGLDESFIGLRDMIKQ